MDRTEFLKSCYAIFLQFEENKGLETENPMLDFFIFISKPETDFIVDILENSELKFKDEPAVDVFFDLWEMLVFSAFAVGFAIGSLRESVTPDIKKSIDNLRMMVAEEAFGGDHTSEAMA